MAKRQQAGCRGCLSAMGCLTIVFVGLFAVEAVLVATRGAPQGATRTQPARKPPVAESTAIRPGLWRERAFTDKSIASFRDGTRGIVHAEFHLQSDALPTREEMHAAVLAVQQRAKFATEAWAGFLLQPGHGLRAFANASADRSGKVTLQITPYTLDVESDKSEVMAFYQVLLDGSPLTPKTSATNATPLLKDP